MKSKFEKTRALAPSGHLNIEQLASVLGPFYQITETRIANWLKKGTGRGFPAPTKITRGAPPYWAVDDVLRWVREVWAEDVCEVERLEVALLSAAKRNKADA